MLNAELTEMQVNDNLRQSFFFSSSSFLNMSTVGGEEIAVETNAEMGRADCKSTCCRHCLSKETSLLQFDCRMSTFCAKVAITFWWEKKKRKSLVSFIKSISLSLVSHSLWVRQDIYKIYIYIFFHPHKYVSISEGQRALFDLLVREK